MYIIAVLSVRLELVHMIRTVVSARYATCDQHIASLLELIAALLIFVVPCY